MVPREVEADRADAVGHRSIVTMLPFHDVPGAASSAVIGLAVDRFRSMPNGCVGDILDLVALLILASRTESDIEPDPSVVAAKVQMDKLGFGSRLELSDVDTLGLFLLFAWRTEQLDLVVSLRRRLSDRDVDSRALVRQMWQRASSLWDRVVEQRQQMDRRCDALRVELDPLLPSGLQLMRHQLEGVVLAREARFRFIFADDMGLGKTIQILACALLLGDDAFPMLICCPLSMVAKWKYEAEKWLVRLDPIVHRLTRKVQVKDLLSSSSRRAILVGSWQQPVHHQLVLQSSGLGLVVGDESHYISNWDAARTQAFVRSRTRARAVLCATGTLMENGRHREAYSQLKAVAPGSLSFLRRPSENGIVPRGDRYPFLYRYCGPEQIIIGRNNDGSLRSVTKFDGRSHEVEFGCLLNRYQARRTKPEVFGPSELPPKSRFIVPVPLTEAQRMALARRRDQIRHQVNQAAAELEAKLVAHSVRPEVIEEKVKRVSRTEAMRLISALRLELGRLKGQWSMVRVKELLAEGHRPVVFCWHNEVAAHLHESYTKAGLDVLLGTGSMTGAARDRVVQSAEAGEHDVVVLTSAYREGITLTAYDRVLMVERWWKPGQEQQAEDRVHRISQTREVGIEYLVCPGTYDDAIGELQVWKERGQVQSQGTTEERVYQWLMAA